MLFDPTLKEKPRVTKHPEAFCWITYERKGLPGRVTIFNAVDEKVPLVLKMKGEEYRQVTFDYTQVVDYEPKAGDMVFRRLKDDEIRQVAEIRAKETRRMAFNMNKKPMSVAALRRRYIQELRHKSIVVKIEEAIPHTNPE